MAVCAWGNSNHNSALAQKSMKAAADAVLRICSAKYPTLDVIEGELQIVSSHLTIAKSYRDAANEQNAELCKLVDELEKETGVFLSSAIQAIPLQELRASL